VQAENEVSEGVRFAQAGASSSSFSEDPELGAFGILEDV
jgi:hypothetical protein